jgi:crotonobetainyl-CoA:carnitine CoA-transferase CaiB-like acyl-CoA transferase
MDMATALANFQAMAVALYARRDEARGRYIESSLLRGGATIQTVSMIQHHLEGGKPQPGLTPSGTFRASDGWINLTILRDADFPVLCDALELAAAKGDPRFATNDLRFANVVALNALLEPAFARRTVADLSARLRSAKLMHQRVNTYLEFLDDPHVKAIGAVAWIEQPGVGRVPVPAVPGLPPLRAGSPLALAPSLDQHGKEILAELERGA